jgi:hypothetical protein
VSPTDLFDEKDLVSTVKEHTYELKLEEKLKKMLKTEKK